MPADRQELTETLIRLRQQLAEVDELDPAMRDQLGAALADILAAVEAKGSGHKPATSAGAIGARLGVAARHFEESHPALSGTIGSLIDALGRMGI